MKKKVIKSITIIISLLIVLGVVIFYAKMDFADTWKTWGKQEDGSRIWPDWTYILLILYKIIIYLFIPIVYTIVLSKYNDKHYGKKKYWKYLLNVLNAWFLVLLVIKLFCNTIFETDRVFGIEFFSSINDIQTLVGFILTFILKRNIKIEPEYKMQKDTVNDFVKDLKITKSYEVSLDSTNNALNLEFRINEDFPIKPQNEFFNVIYIYYLKDMKINYPLGESNVLYIGESNGEKIKDMRSLGFRFKHCLNGNDKKQNISLSKIYNDRKNIGLDIIVVGDSIASKDIEKEYQNKFLNKYGAYPISTGASYSKDKIVNIGDNDE